MKIDKSKIKPLPWWFKFNIFARKAVGLGGRKYVYFNHELLKDLLSDNPSHENIAILLHELKHQERMNEVPWFKLKYVLSAKFRIQEELIADEPRFKYLKENGVEMDLVGRAKRLSGPMYRWAISYDDALERLRRLWNKV